LQVLFKLFKEEGQLVHRKRQCESKDWSREGSRGAKEQEKVKIQGTKQAAAVAQSTTRPSPIDWKCSETRRWRWPAIACATGHRRPSL